MTQTPDNHQPHATLGKAWGHLRTICRHKFEVGRLCFKVGLYWQGVVHDLSKFGPTEFMTGARYFQGDCSPNAAERLDRGLSEAWLHHKGRNKHHFEYWLDTREPGCVEYTGKPMPTRYIVEMFCDRVAACKVYQRKDYTQGSALAYYDQSADYNALLHPDSAALLERMLGWLAEDGEQVTCTRIRNEIVRPRYRAGEQARW